MRLFEFDDSDIDIKLAVIVDELKTELDNGELADSIPTDEFLDRLEARGVPLDIEQLREKIQEKPLSDVVSNMDDDNVEFNGNSNDDLDFDDQADQEKVVAQMAKSAMK